MDNFSTEFPQTTNATTPRAEKLRDFFHSPLTWMISGIIIITTIIAIIIIATSKRTITYSVSENYRVHIDNLAEILPNLPEDYKDGLESALYNQITSDLSGSSYPTPASGAIIRNNTLNAITVNDNFYVGDYIIDIPSIELSYQVSYQYGNGEDGVQIEPFASITFYCIKDEKLRIYKDFTDEFCSANHDFYRSNIITYLTPYKAEDGTFIISYIRDFTSPSGYGLVVNYGLSDKDISTPESIQKFESTANEKIESWLKSQGLDPANYPLHHESEGGGL